MNTVIIKAERYVINRLVDVDTVRDALKHPDGELKLMTYGIPIGFLTLPYFVGKVSPNNLSDQVYALIAYTLLLLFSYCTLEKEFKEQRALLRVYIPMAAFLLLLFIINNYL